MNRIELSQVKAESKGDIFYKRTTPEKNIIGYWDCNKQKAIRINTMKELESILKENTQWYTEVLLFDSQEVYDEWKERI